MADLPTPAWERRDAFAWGCCIQDFHFLYVYGSTADYWAFQHQDHEGGGQTLHKGYGASLEAVQALAEAAATQLAPLYEGFGSVSVGHASDRLKRRRRWPVLAMDA